MEVKRWVLLAVGVLVVVVLIHWSCPVCQQRWRAMMGRT